jgi:hypothetical protein
MMSSNLESEEAAICYSPKLREYGIRVLDGGSSFILIHHCPWCGTSLPPSLRTRWFEALEARGIKVGDTTIPEAFNSDAWWKSSDVKA